MGRAHLGSFEAANGDKWITLSAPYDENLVTELKAAFPKPDRWWNPEKNQWMVRPALRAELFVLLNRLGYYVEEDSVTSARKVATEKANFRKRQEVERAKARQRQEAEKAWQRQEAEQAKAREKVQAKANEQAKAKEQAERDRRSAEFHSMEARDRHTLQIAPHAGYDVARAAYRALSARYHPDRGGKLDAMVALNAAWERLAKICKRT